MIWQVMIPLQELVGVVAIAPRWYEVTDFDNEYAGEVLLRLQV